MTQPATVSFKPAITLICTLFIVGALAIVHSSVAAPAAKKSQTDQTPEPAERREILRDIALLPAEAQRMRQAILQAAMTGDIEQIRVPLEMNELKPMLAATAVTDAVAHFKAASGDGEGREMLAILIGVLRAGFIRKNAGKDDELYIWPYFAELPIGALTPAQEVELLTLVTPARLKEMRAKGRYDHFRLGIARNGAWHFFMKGE